LHCLTEKKKGFVWTQECDEAFKVLRKRLVETPFLFHPHFTKSFTLDADASDKAIGAVAYASQ